MKVIEHKENPFPLDEEGRLNSILNIVNTELKTVVFLHIDDVPCDRHELKKRVRQTVGRGVYLPTPSMNYQGYCHQTFYPIGAVAEETVVKETGDTTYFGYSLTNAGKKYGLPVAAFTLDYTIKSGHSIFPILGSTSTSLGKKRAPLNRIQILERLREGNLRIADLESEVRICDSSITRSLDQLQKFGFVYFDSVEEVSRGESLVCYEWIPGKEIDAIKPYYTDLILTQRVAQLLKEKGILTSSEAFRTLGDNRKDFRPFETLLGHLVREGVARHVKWKGTKYSEAQITDNGLEFLIDYADKVKSALMDGDELGMMKEMYIEFIKNPKKLREYARTAIELYLTISRKVNPVGRRERNEQIIEFIRAHQGSRPVEIKKALNIHDLSHFLTPLVESGVLRKEKTDRSSRYFIK